MRAAAVAFLLLGPTCLAARGQCVDAPFSRLEAQGYRVGAVRLSGPLVAGGRIRDIIAKHVVAGQPLKADAIEAARGELRTTIRDTPSLFDPLVTATVVGVGVSACDEGGKEADVVFKVFTTKIGRSISRNAQSADAVDPAGRLGVGPSPLRFQVVPTARYDPLERVVVGARGWASVPRIFDRLEGAVEGSSEVVNLDLDVSGNHEGDDALRFLEWRVGVHRRERLTAGGNAPTGSGDLKAHRVAAQVMAATRPLSGLGPVLRFASSVEAGRQDMETPSRVPTGLLNEAGYGAWKGATGVTFRLKGHDIRASYGLQLGFTRGENAVDYTKSVAELVYSGRAPAGTHRVLEFGSTLAVGRLTGDHGVPIAERFFGGTGAIPFLAGDGWTFQAAPQLRSFASSSFAGGGLGGTSYRSLSLTASVPLWLKPLVPIEVSGDDVVRQSLDGQLNSGEQALETLHETSDPAHGRAVAAAKPLRLHITALTSRLAEMLQSMPAGLKETADRCVEQADTLLAVVDAISEKTHLRSLLTEPVDEDDVTLSSVSDLCFSQLNAALADSTLASIGGEISDVRRRIAKAIAEIDVPRARARAKKDMAFARDAVGIIMNEMNAFSVGPVISFDVARLSQSTPVPARQTRYGLGTGVRLTIASALHIDVGYAWNVNRVDTERRGSAYAGVAISTFLGD